MNSSRRGVFKISIIASIVLVAGLLIAWGFQQELTGRSVIIREPMRNYGVVWENKLTRSGLPHKESGWQWLRDRGTKSIVTFRTENDVEYSKFGFDQVLRIPLAGDQVPTDEQVNTFLKFVQDPGNWPVHMHCSAGKGRTGMMAALVRYAVDGWPLDKALAEARLYRGGDDLTEVRVAWLKSWAAKHKPGSYRLSNKKAPTLLWPRRAVEEGSLGSFILTGASRRFSLKLRPTLRSNRDSAPSTLGAFPDLWAALGGLSAREDGPNG